MLADVLAHIAEVDARKIYLLYGASMYVYCTAVLGFSESAAFRRITAARLARRFPAVFDDVAEGRLTLAGLNVLSRHVGTDGRLLTAAHGLTTRAIKQLVAANRPTPDVPDEITPIAVDRVVVRFSASTRFADKLREAKALLSHSLPAGRFEDVLERALDAVIADAANARFASTESPRQARPITARTRHIPAEVKRAVHARDQGRCTFVCVDGRRCNSEAFVQFHHDDPYARGGAHDAATIRQLCSAHNLYQAEQDYGVAHMARAPGRGATPAISSGPPSGEVPGPLAAARAIRTPADSPPGQVSGQLAPARVIRTLAHQTRADAVSALTLLGFGAPVARRAVTSALAQLEDTSSIEEVVRAALRYA